MDKRDEADAAKKYGWPFCAASLCDVNNSHAACCTPRLFRIFAINSSDHLTLWKAYEGWVDSMKERDYKFCHRNFLSRNTLQVRRPT